MPSHRKPITAAWVWSQIDERENDECWLWTGVQFSDGYGRIRNQHAHRVVWEIAYHQVAPSYRVVRHTCDTPLCCNPAHLLLGTHAQNMRDMVERGRGVQGHAWTSEEMRGERNAHAKLTADQVVEIRARYAVGGVRQADLAREFGVSQPLIGYIVRGEAWVHLGPVVSLSPMVRDANGRWAGRLT